MTNFKMSRWIALSLLVCLAASDFAKAQEPANNPAASKCARLKIWIDQEDQNIVTYRLASNELKKQLDSDRARVLGLSAGLIFTLSYVALSSQFVRLGFRMPGSDSKSFMDAISTLSKSREFLKTARGDLAILLGASIATIIDGVYLKSNTVEMIRLKNLLEERDALFTIEEQNLEKQKTRSDENCQTNYIK